MNRNSHVPAKPVQILSSVKPALVAVALFALVGCQGALDGLDRKAESAVPSKLVNKMKAYGMRAKSPIMMRIFKQENTLEIWKQKDTGRYALLAEYEICKWSGKYGPKFREGDRQAPEGFYTVNKHQLNPRSKYHLSFNMGYPNKYDRAHGRTGSHLMIHGACSSAGCYSMTDEYVQEIYALARESLRGGQKKFQIQAYPFRLTAENLFKNRDSKHYKFWTMLKQGYDHFEITRVPPKVDVCNRSYVFNTVSSGNYNSRSSCPALGMPQSLALAYTKKQNAYQLQFDKLLAKAEGRENEERAALTFKDTLPGISVISPPKPEVEEKPIETSETEKSAPVETSEKNPERQSEQTTAQAKAVPSSEFGPPLPLENTTSDPLAVAIKKLPKS